MTSEQPTRSAKTIFLEAIESYLPSEWNVYVAGACHGDPELRQRVDALLKAHLEKDSDFDQSAMTDTFVSSVAERPGTEIGPYKLLQKIGEGGFGVVYMAEQLRPVRRKVALKIIKPGMDTQEVVARFEAERQALALMDHPNIARVFDGGATESGRPYFVMELVKGVAITKFADENNLGIRQRISLFAQVCQAIQHAHQRGVIHRDIKPSNVLVTLHDGKPVPLVIDFGVAKAIDQKLTEKTMFTTFGQIIGTPQYMSPEQAEMSGLEVDNRTDVYSLGVLLYELLTGTTPLPAKQIRETAYCELQRLIRENEPPKPSVRADTLDDASNNIAHSRGLNAQQLSLKLRGDLDWIVMKALDKDRHRRYESAGQFAEDVSSHLTDRPVKAGPPSAAYRLRKYLRRNRSKISRTLGTTCTLLLLICFSGAVAKAWHAARQADLLREEAVRIETLARQHAQNRGTTND